MKDVENWLKVAGLAAGFVLVVFKAANEYEKWQATRQHRLQRAGGA